MNKVQELQFELMKLASFNGFDGEVVSKSLITNEHLWRGAIMTRIRDLICLRDIEDDNWNVDTLYILPVSDCADELEKLASTWGADEIQWIGETEACKLLGEYNSSMRGKEKLILRVWWD